MDIIVGVSDMKVSGDASSSIVTYSLGSCIGVAIYDPVAQVGGLLHFMLPDSSIDPQKAQDNPYMFADSGLPPLFKSAYQLGAKKNRLKVVVAGGSQILDQRGFFNIGKRNYMALKKILWKNNVMITYEHVGGQSNRTIRLFLPDGRVSLKVSGDGVMEI